MVRFGLHCAFYACGILRSVQSEWAFGRIEPDPDTLLRTLPNGEAVLLHTASEIYFGLDQIGLRIWELLAERTDVEDLIVQMETEYDVDPIVVRSDVERLVGELLGAGLVKRSPELDNS